MLLYYFGARLENINGHVRTNHILTTGKLVNCFHRLGAKKAPAYIENIEKSEDGVIEEFTHIEYKNIPITARGSCDIFCPICMEDPSDLFDYDENTEKSTVVG